MKDIAICLWFDGDAEEAAGFYTALLPDSYVDAVHRAPGDYPAGKAGDVLLVDFTLMGRRFQGLNGGAHVAFSEAVSLSIPCADQAEVDHYWDALVADGGRPVQCGWLKDRFGLSWQIVPDTMGRLMDLPDRAAAGRAFAAMMDMVKLDVAALERAAQGD